MFASRSVYKLFDGDHTPTSRHLDSIAFPPGAPTHTCAVVRVPINFIFKHARTVLVFWYLGEAGRAVAAMSARPVAACELSAHHRRAQGDAPAAGRCSSRRPSSGRAPSYIGTLALRRSPTTASRCRGPRCTSCGSRAPSTEAPGRSTASSRRTARSRLAGTARIFLPLKFCATEQRARPLVPHID